MTDPPSYDPRLLALLDEAARDPDAQVLRPYRPGAWRGIRGITEPLSPRTTGLTNVEREIVDVYREEASRLLFEYARHALRQLPGIRDYMQRSLTVELFAPDVPIAALHERTTDVLQRDALAVEKRPRKQVRHLLERCASGAFLEIRPEDLLLASLRLYPRDGARAWSALSLVEKKAWGSALKTLTDVLSGTPTDLMRSCVFDWIGLCYVETARMERALLAYQTACACTDVRATPFGSWFGVACNLLDEQEALKAARGFDDLVGPEHPVVEHLADTFRKTWRPNAAVASFMKRIEDRLGPASLRLSHAAAS